MFSILLVFYEHRNVNNEHAGFIIVIIYRTNAVKKQKKYFNRIQNFLF